MSALVPTISDSEPHLSLRYRDLWVTDERVSLPTSLPLAGGHLSESSAVLVTGTVVRQSPERVVSVLVGTTGTFDEPCFNETPEWPDYGYQPDQNPPTRLVPVVPAFHLDCKARPDHPKKDQPEEGVAGTIQRC